MQDKIVELIAEHFGVAFLIGLVLIGALIFLVWWCRGVYERLKQVDKLPCKENGERIQEHAEKLKRVENLPCKENGEQIRKHAEKHSEIAQAVTKIETSIEFMQKSIDSLTQSIQKNTKLILDPFTQAHSPISITDAGKEMIKRIGMDKMFERNWPRIESLIRENAVSKNPYDIQEFCTEQAVVFPEKFLEPEELDRVKLDAYNNGLNLLPYMRVIAVMSRDRYLEENGYKIEDIDKYSPKE